MIPLAFGLASPTLSNMVRLSIILQGGGVAQEFYGKWVVEPDPKMQNGLSHATILRYEITIVPRWSIPSTIVTTIVKCGLPANVRAIARRAEEVGIFLRALQFICTLSRIVGGRLKLGCSSWQ